MTMLLTVVGTLTACWSGSRLRDRRNDRKAALAAWCDQQRAVAQAVAAGDLTSFWFPVAPACSYDEAREVLVHVAPAYADEEGEVLNFPVRGGWDADSILVTLAEIEAL